MPACDKYSVQVVIANPFKLGSQLASPYGPIGSPRKSALDSNTNNTLDINRYSMLSLQDYAGNADDDREVTGLI